MGSSQHSESHTLPALETVKFWIRAKRTSLPCGGDVRTMIFRYLQTFAIQESAIQESAIAGSSSCSRNRRSVSVFRFSPDFADTKAPRDSDQSSLKLVVRAEIQICLTGFCGVNTNLVPPSSNSTLSTP